MNYLADWNKKLKLSVCQMLIWSYEYFADNQLRYVQ